MTRFLAVILLMLVSAVPATSSTINFNLYKGGGNGSVADFSAGGLDPFFVLAGSDSRRWGPVDTRYLALAPEPWGYPDNVLGWQVTGSWTYLTQDGPYWDTFGYVINGVKTQLSTVWGSVAQSGTFSFLVQPGDAFGWYVWSRDDCCGRAIATVSASIRESFGNSPAPIPLPAPALLLLAGLGALGIARRRRIAA